MLKLLKRKGGGKHTVQQTDNGGKKNGTSPRSSKIDALHHVWIEGYLPHRLSNCETKKHSFRMAQKKLPLTREKGEGLVLVGKDEPE